MKKLLFIKNSGHFVMLEQTEMFNLKIREWLNNLN